MSILFSQTKLGSLDLQNRLVMAPMTRNRAIDNLPNRRMALYYAQRATVGLIISEGTSPSPSGLGYPRSPGLYSEAQVVKWKEVTEAVHKQGAKMFAQIAHCGRIAHPRNLPPGTRILAPSAIAAPGEMFTQPTRAELKPAVFNEETIKAISGMKPFPIPEAMTEEDIKGVIEEHAVAAMNAISAGFDGVELSSANGCLLEQFINPHTNQRTDQYGGSMENRLRIVLEVIDAMIEAIGEARVGIRLSPFGIFNYMETYDGVVEDYTYLAKQLNMRNILYIHILDHTSMGAPEVPDSIKTTFRNLFKGALILSGGYDRVRAEQDLEDGKCDLVSVGRLFVSNPDLVVRWKSGAYLNSIDFNTICAFGPKGYIDYPSLSGN